MQIVNFWEVLCDCSIDGNIQMETVARFTDKELADRYIKQQKEKGVHIYYKKRNVAFMICSSLDDVEPAKKFEKDTELKMSLLNRLTPEEIKFIKDVM